MQDTTITFLSSRGCRISADLSLVKEYLIQNGDVDKFSFRYYIKNELSKNPMVRRGYIRAKQSFCEDMTNAICVDGSLTKGMQYLNEKGSRILLAVPYEYQFKNILAVEAGRRTEKSEAFQNFTHIVAGSPFSCKMLRDGYELAGISVIEDVNLPFTWDINQTERQRQVKEQFLFYYPGMKEKKVLAILTFGNISEEKNPCADFELKQFLQKLGEEWFVITNNEAIVETAVSLNSKFCDSFAYINHVLPNQDLLYFADALVTNKGRYAAYFASRRKPLFCPQYKNNFFERYMKFHYPDIYIKNLNGLLEYSFDEKDFTKEHQKFSEEFSYFPIHSPYEKIEQLFL